MIKTAYGGNWDLCWVNLEFIVILHNHNKRLLLPKSSNFWVTQLGFSSVSVNVNKALQQLIAFESSCQEIELFITSSALAPFVVGIHRFERLANNLKYHIVFLMEFYQQYDYFPSEEIHKRLSELSAYCNINLVLWYDSFMNRTSSFHKRPVIYSKRCLTSDVIMIPLFLL